MRHHLGTIVRFGISGVIATAVHYGTLAALVEIVRVPSVGLANGLASIVGIAASFAGNRIFVFASRTPILDSLSRFVLLYASLAAMHTTALYLWSDLVHLPYTPGFVLATGLATMISYVGNRYFVFRPAPGPT
jgi:putative flippase GtrA